MMIGGINAVRVPGRLDPVAHHLHGVESTRLRKQLRHFDERIGVKFIRPGVWMIEILWHDHLGVVVFSRLALDTAALVMFWLTNGVVERAGRGSAAAGAMAQRSWCASR